MSDLVKPLMRGGGGGHHPFVLKMQSKIVLFTTMLYVINKYFHFTEQLSINHKIV